MTAKREREGLRERQKARRYEKILQVAERLFHRRGYVATTIAEIADKADLSPATVHNYFGSKGAILVALIDRYDVEYIQIQTERLKKLSNSPREDIAQLLEGNVQDALDRLPAEAWMHAAANSILEAGGELEQGYVALNKRQYDLLYIPLRAHRDMGNLPSDFDVETAREILEVINHALFAQRIGATPFDMEDYRSKLSRYLDLIIPACKPTRSRRSPPKR